MKTVAVVPIKRLREAKSRLAEVLSPQERARLAGDMLEHVLEAIVSSGVVGKVAILSPNPEELSLTPETVTLKQRGHGLNNILEQGREWAEKERADALLVLFADLPLLRPDDLSKMVELGGEPGTIVLAPDRHGNGTNAMLAHPPRLAAFLYGPGSFVRHSAFAQLRKARLQVYRARGTSTDVDTPDDLEYVRSLKEQPCQTI